MDLAKIDHSFGSDIHTGDYWITFTNTLEGYNMILTCNNCIRVEGRKAYCDSDKLVNITLSLNKGNKQYIVQWNGMCDVRKNIVTVSNIVTTADIHSVSLSWTYNGDNMNNYIVYYMNETNYNHRIITTTTPSYLLDNLHEKTLYQICIATIDATLGTGKYRCVTQRTDFSETGPVVDVRPTASSDSIDITWNKPGYKYDSPEGYIVSYRDTIGTCGEIIIQMVNYVIDDTNWCANKKSIHWPGLMMQTLTIDHLTPYTTYTITISPINKKKIRKEVTVTVITQQGKSGPVSNIVASILPGWLRITYNAPATPNGIVSKYKVRIVQTRLGLCTTTHRQVMERSDINGNLVDVEIDKLTKCATYTIEVYPINGWTQNNGEGQMASNIFEYKPDDSLKISNINSNFISANMARISWDHSRINEDCTNIGYMIELMNTANESDCITQILSNENCTALQSIIDSGSRCAIRIYKTHSNTGPTWDGSIGGTFTPSKSYRVNIWKVTNDAIKQTQPLSMYSMDRDCFTDCFTNKVYNGIRSHPRCVAWKDSYYKSTHPTRTDNICTVKWSSKPWCSTGSSYVYCNVPRCSDVTTGTGCVGVTEIDTTDTTATIRWTALEYERSIIGYITVLHNSDNICVRRHIQMCNDCIMESSLEERVTQLYSSCLVSLVATRSISHESTFDTLHQNRRYFVYIIPIITSSLVGDIRNTTLSTKMAKPDIPTRIINSGQDLTSLSFSWEEPKETETKGFPDHYLAILKHGDNIIKEEKAYIAHTQFINLNLCTKYCLYLRSVNNAGQSELGEVRCQYTLTPRLGHVTTRNIESGPSLNRVISWSYSESDDCHRYYEVRYTTKFINTEQSKKTNGTNIVLDNLHSNRIYTVQIRAHTDMETVTKEKVGHYSGVKEFYTGIVTPVIDAYEEGITNDGRQLNISWARDMSRDGSIFEYILLLTNSSKSCLERVHFICRTCSDPYKSKNLDERNKSEREKLLKCQEGKQLDFSKDQNSLNNVFKMKRALTNYSVMIYAVNLVGVHNIYGKNQTYIAPNASTSLVAAVSCVIVVIILTVLVLMILVKVKHRPRCLYTTLMKTEKPGVKDTKPTRPRVSMISEKGRMESKVKSPAKPRKPMMDSLDMSNSNPSMANDHLPLLEPKRKSNGIPLKEFSAYYTKMTQKENDPLIQEYKKLTTECKKMEKELGLTVNTGKSSANTKKNRFVNILPFDQTRVILEGKQSYINANYIPFNCDEKRYEYIASQGPIEQSIKEFWQMIWTLNLNCIVMLTRTMEDNKFKCLQYWPENIGEEESYGNKNELSVTLEEETEIESHIERSFLVKNKNSNEERKILHLHMHTWSDHSAPNLEHFDKLLFRFHEIANTVAVNPYLIHCSAGVGRTGTLICIDRIIKQLVSGSQEINIYETVFDLRHYRNFMVQRQAQYIFIHDYIDHFLKKYMKMDETEETVYFNEE